MHSEKEIAVSGARMCQADCFLFWKSFTQLGPRWFYSSSTWGIGSSVRMTYKYFSGIEAQVVRLTRYLDIKHFGSFPIKYLFLYAVGIFLLFSYFASLYQQNLDFEFKFPFILSI